MLSIKNSLKPALVITALLASSLQAFAVAFTVGGSSSFDSTWASGAWSGKGSDDFYKQNFGDAEEGPQADLFSTEWGNFKKGGDALLAIITWSPGTVFDLSSLWLKAGKSTWFATNVAAFDATVHTSIRLYAPAKYGISNVGMHGTITTVPDTSSTVALLGLGLGVLGLVARRRKA